MGGGGRWRARTWQKRARLVGSREKQESSGFQVQGRVAGCFCRLPVAPRKSHSRAAVQVAGFPTGSPGGRGRGGPCTAAGARPPRLSRARCRRPSAAPPSAAARRGTPGCPEVASGLMHPARHRRRCWESGCSSFSGSQQTPGGSLRGQVLSAGKDRRVLATPETTGISRAAGGGSSLFMEPQRVARGLRGCAA